jgi:hypothetical protein
VPTLAGVTRLPRHLLARSVVIAAMCLTSFIGLTGAAMATPGPWIKYGGFGDNYRACVETRALVGHNGYETQPCTNTDGGHNWFFYYRTR